VRLSDDDAASEICIFSSARTAFESTFSGGGAPLRRISTKTRTTTASATHRAPATNSVKASERAGLLDGFLCVSWRLAVTYPRRIECAAVNDSRGRFSVIGKRRSAFRAFVAALLLVTAILGNCHDLNVTDG
jgi:hypothetical protein